MENNFDEVIDRNNTDCAKYHEMNQKFGRDKLHFAVADMDFRSPQPILTALQDRLSHGVFGYTNLPNNYKALVKEWMKRRYQCDIEEEWVMFSPRINMAANMAVETFTNPGDKIILNTPAYPALSSAILKYDRQMLESPLELVNGEYQINFEALERQMDTRVAMLILCNPHNPTGRVWSRQGLEKVVHHIENNYRFVYDYIKTYMPLFECVISQGTYFAWINYQKTGLTDEQMEDFFLNKAKVTVYMGSHFGESGRGFFRINFVTSRIYLEKALKYIRKAYEEIF